jgi:mono/diheme cytochrome c family protein
MTLRRAVRVLAWAMMASALSATANAQEPIGAKPYSEVCEPCHGTEGRGKIGPRLVPMSKDVDEVLAIVREGKGEMPQISRREITDAQVAQVVQYLKGIAQAKSNVARR